MRRSRNSTCTPHRIEVRLKRPNECRVPDEYSVLVIVLFRVRRPVVAARKQKATVKDRVLIVQYSPSTAIRPLQLKTCCLQPSNV